DIVARLVYPRGPVHLELFDIIRPSHGGPEADSPRGEASRCDLDRAGEHVHVPSASPLGAGTDGGHLEDRGDVSRLGECAGRRGKEEGYAGFHKSMTSGPAKD